MASSYRNGILHELDSIETGQRTTKTYPVVPANLGTVVVHQGTGISGAIVEWTDAAVVLRDDSGRDHRVRSRPGGFIADGNVVTLGRPAPAPAATTITASGSIASPDLRAKRASASRIWVEGIHDAELVEYVWGDDPRDAAIVVEPMHGADHLDELIRGFGPQPGRRLGVLLDHYVSGTKEYRLGHSVSDPHVLVTGHEFVDIWQAVRPAVMGLTQWPSIPRGEDWKSGMAHRLGAPDVAAMWRTIKGKITSHRDLDPSLVGAVESLIDFVAS